jgi:Tol biopolymer transport system component
MTAGTKAFHGNSQASLIGAILKDTPEPASSLRPGIPPALDRVIGACLEKNPEDRWQSVRDVTRELKWVRQPVALPHEHSAAAVSLKRVSRLAWALIVVFGIGTLGFLLQLYRKPSPVLPVTRLSATLPREQLYNGISSPGRGLAISPDGRTLAYVSGSPQPRRQIYIRSLDRPTPQPGAGTEGAVQPFFSPDGKWLAFFTIAGELKKLSLDQGSVPVTLVKGLLNGQWCFGVWRDDNVIIFSAFENLLEVSADGGTPTPLTNIDAASSESFHEFPQVVPSTGDVVFTVGLKDGKNRVDLIRKDNKQRSTILQDTKGVLLTHSGQLLFSRDGVMMVAPFDAQHRRISGPAVPSPESVVTDGVLRGSAFGNLQAAIADDGTLAYVPPGADKVESTIGWVDIKGEFAAAGTVPGNLSDASLSPDGKTVALVSDTRVSLFDLARSVTTPLNLGDRQTETVSWYPDGKRLTLGGPTLSLYDLDARKEAVLIGVGRPKREAVWSPDGRTVVYMTFNPNNDIYMLTTGASDATPKPFSATEAIELGPSISPNGRLIAYRSSGSAQTNQTNVYVSRFPDGSGIVQVTDRGGGSPFWSPDGRSLFFSGPPGVLQTAQVTEGSTIQVGAVQTLFPQKDFQIFGIAPDGKRFLAVRVGKIDPPSQIVVVQNWMQELKRLLPVQ